jgi:hypothetical protein
VNWREDIRNLKVFLQDRFPLENVEVEPVVDDAWQLTGLRVHPETLIDEAFARSVLAPRVEAGRLPELPIYCGSETILSHLSAISE